MTEKEKVINEILEFQKEFQPYFDSLSDEEREIYEETSSKITYLLCQLPGMGAKFMATMMYNIHGKLIK
jgi:hypothetical protein